MRGLVVALVAACATLGQPRAQADNATPAAPAWQDYLKRSTIERVQISPDGTRLAVAQRDGDSTVVTIRDAATLATLKRFETGDGGEVERLSWIDDKRILVAVNRVMKKYNVSFSDPTLAIITVDDFSRYVLPANFLATIDGDVEHLLVIQCSNYGEGGCVGAVHKVEIGHTNRMGEKLIDAPDREASLRADRHGHVRFAIGVDDKANSKLHAHKGNDTGWTLVNDSTQTGLHVWPLGVDSAGEFAFLESERESGPSVVERYDFGTGARTEVYRDAVSDVVTTIDAFDGETPLGAYYGPTAPRPVFWNTQHPDAQAIEQIVRAFPGRMIGVTSASRDRSKAIVLASGDRDPGSWYLFDRTTKKAKLIARARSWLPEAQLPKTREVVVQARDGKTLYGVLTLPPDGREKDLPMVVVPHGGPHGVYDSASFDSEAGLLASQGYAVLRVNYRGSGGYGKQFEQAGWRQWGRAMQDDVTDATKWAIGQGIADGKRVCLYGASYGGYAALMGGVREPGLYRCVAGYAAPYDLAKMYKWGSIRRSDLGLDYLEKVLGKDKADLASRSPAQNAAAIKVPVFIAHGRLDARVDVAHSRKMVKALKEAGVDVEFQEYMREGHGLNLDEDERDFYTRLLAFLAKHTTPQ
ncbi:Prolyl oligopeptidase family protein [Lysobacter dokdonensis DS-58]|uniref:Prolyl oligopeptidase family protein n=1 Tax=Lysobacter dokdonensis DS-58 TaxID=1300345 RepID=A0A0A2WI10_9GAMM|nr:Prolyl oligopeptidase family protein [Lysobacter dokdonensis DS-58]